MRILVVLYCGTDLNYECILKLYGVNIPGCNYTLVRLYIKTTGKWN